MTVEQLRELLIEFPPNAIVRCEVDFGKTPTDIDYVRGTDKNVYAVLNDYYKVGT